MSKETYLHNKETNLHAHRSLFNVHRSLLCVWMKERPWQKTYSLLHLECNRDFHALRFLFHAHRSLFHVPMRLRKSLWPLIAFGLDDTPNPIKGQRDFLNLMGLFSQSVVQSHSPIPWGWRVRLHDTTHENGEWDWTTLRMQQAVKEILSKNTRDLQRRKRP